MSSTVTLTIDGRTVEAPQGATVLEAARMLGVEIPTLCHFPGLPPSASCLVCLVKIDGRMVPSCATVAEEGMKVESETEEVFEARRTALELLLSDHTGDCLAPCHRICPAQLNIPLMLRHIQNGQVEKALQTLCGAVSLPGATAWLCPAPCEKGCRRGVWDAPTAIRDEERFLVQTELEKGWTVLPEKDPPLERTAAVVGAGPTGLAAAWRLARGGARTVLFHRGEKGGGSLRAETKRGTLPAEVLEHELARLRALGVEFRPRTELGKDVSLEALREEFDAVILALGPSGREQAGRLGLASGPAGLRAKPHTGETDLPGVFAAGAAVKRTPHIARALAEGQNAGEAAIAWLRTGRAAAPARPFSSMTGRVERKELADFLRLAGRIPRVSPASETGVFRPAEARAEASRCLHCDCRSVGACKLQRYAEQYGVNPKRFSGRQRMEIDARRGEALFEPGKCILCGICVQIAERAREELGLTFIGRGFDVRIGAPFSDAIADGLRRAARECVAACPTGALTLREETAVPPPSLDRFAPTPENRAPDA